MGITTIIMITGMTMGMITATVTAMTMITGMTTITTLIRKQTIHLVRNLS